MERLILHFPLSREGPQCGRLRDSLTLYRIMLGQPRQEDMMQLLKQRSDRERGGAATSGRLGAKDGEPSAGLCIESLYLPMISAVHGTQISFCHVL